jgi:hypothetical protein
MGEPLAEGLGKSLSGLLLGALRAARIIRIAAAVRTARITDRPRLHQTTTGEGMPFYKAQKEVTTTLEKVVEAPSVGEAEDLAEHEDDGWKEAGQMEQYLDTIEVDVSDSESEGDE